MGKRNRSYENRLNLVRYTVKNSGEERIKNALLKFGINKAYFRQGEGYLQEIERLEDQFVAKNKDYFKALDTFNKTQARLYEVSTSHIRLCRLLLGELPGAREKFNLNGGRPRAFLPWLETTKQFYTSILNDPAALNILRTRKIMRTQLSTILKNLETLEGVNRSKNILREERRAVNVRLKEALTQAEKWRREVIMFARAGLGSDSQLLKSLGVVVKS